MKPTHTLAGLFALSLPLAAACAPELRLGTAGGGGSSTTTSPTSTTSSAGGGGHGGGAEVKALFAAGYGDAADQSIEAVAVSPEGAVVLAGRFAGSVDFGKGALTSAGGDDVFVAALDAHGSCSYAVAFGDAAPQRALAVAAGPKGRVAVAGENAGQLTTSVAAAGGMDAFVLVLDGGSVTWGRGLGGGGYQSITGVAFDAAGNVVLAGYFSGSVDLGGGPLVSAGGYDVFVAQLDKDGQHLWSRRFGDARDQRAVGLALGPGGEVHVVGTFEGSVDFGAGALESAGSSDVFVAKLGSDGTPVWTKRFGDATAQSARGIAAGADGSVWVGGQSDGVIDLGGGAVVQGDGGSLFVGKLDAAGGHVWSRGFARTGAASVGGLAVDGNGQAVLVGNAGGGVDVGGGVVLSPDGVMMIGLDAAGRVRWGKRFGDGSAQAARGVAMEAGGVAWVAGRFGGEMDVGLAQGLVSKGGEDGFVLEVGP